MESWPPGAGPGSPMGVAIQPEELGQGVQEVPAGRLLVQGKNRKVDLPFLHFQPQPKAAVSRRSVSSPASP